ncbi:hypothetical protein KI809_09605 [Geobacter pelophilus]|uniref:Dolichyl-phosphate-mannose-protein mannosyltransferase n=1 Tax=Geoanaerobacter pelophilus TaxID=60036 RepID=A0AAW4L696_9BACT|nr:hypothetical protein [Geoanaerobacter pelophilus]MBT0664553.1 hypothetical protein [Geoanaerobacter pelophilus]
MFLILSRLADVQKRFLPLMFSLLFGLHPIATESVCWLSGRTDLFSGFFILLSTYLLLRYRERNGLFFLLGSLVCIAVSYLAKEVALGYLVGWLLLLLLNEAESISSDADYSKMLRAAAATGFVAAVLLVVSYSLWVTSALLALFLVWLCLIDRRMIVRCVLLVVAVAFGATVMYLTRKMVFASGSGQISATITLIQADSNYTIQTFLGAIAFYLKKFIFPFPLNFAIREISPYYNIAGVATAPFILLFMLRGTLATTFFITGICLILPALPLSLGAIAWTSYAERYVYIASAFFIISLGCYFVTSSRLHQVVIPVCCFIVLVFAASTVHRSYIWSSNLSLFEDTVKKAPNFRFIRNNYLIALRDAGRYKEAEKQYRLAQKLPSVQYVSDLDLNYANLLAITGRYSEADRLYAKVFEKSGESNLYLDFLRQMHATALGKERVFWGNRLLEISERTIAMTKDYAKYYQMGKVALDIGERSAARKYFVAGCSFIPSNDPQSHFACRLADSLQ